MNIVEYLDDPCDFELMKRDTMEEALRRHSDDIGLVNYNLNKVEAILNPNGDDEDAPPVVAVTRMQVRPRESSILRWESFILRPEEMVAFADNMHKLRLDETASPFVDSDLDFERPEGNVFFDHDRYVFDPTIEAVLDGVVDLEMVGADISQTNNVPLLDMGREVQAGIQGVKHKKHEINSKRANLIRQARSVLHLIDQVSVEQIFMGKTPREIYTYVDNALQRRAEAHSISQEAFHAIDVLHRLLKDIEESTGATVKESLGAFEESLATPGYQFPSTVAAPKDVIEHYGVGGKEYLRL